MTYIPDGMVADVLDKKLSQNPETCPICSGDIDTGISTQFDRKCFDCNTKFQMYRTAADGRPIPSVVVSTTPVNRLKKQIRQRMAERSVMEELASENDGDPDCADCGDPVSEDEAVPGPHGHPVHDDCGDDDD